jgi:hypothetical protein
MAKFCFYFNLRVVSLFHKLRAPLLCEGQNSGHAVTYSTTCCHTHTYSSSYWRLQHSKCRRYLL